jgi:hypothetical protein
MFHALISCIENTFDTKIYVTFVHLLVQTSSIDTFIHVSNMFSTHDIHVQNV